MITIESPDASIFKGQTLKGSVYFSSESPRIAEEIGIMLF
jgi:hypothetical protein